MTNFMKLNLLFTYKTVLEITVKIEQKQKICVITKIKNVKISCRLQTVK